MEDLFLKSVTHTETGKKVNIDVSGFRTVGEIKEDGKLIKD